MINFLVNAIMITFILYAATVLVNGLYADYIEYREYKQQQKRMERFRSLYRVWSKQEVFKMLFNAYTPFYYVGGAWQSATTPEEALRILADTCPDCEELTKTLTDTYEVQKKQLQEQAKEIEELKQALEKQQEEYAGLYTVLDDLNNAFIEMQQARKGTKAYNDIVKSIHQYIYDMQTSL